MERPPPTGLLTSARLSPGVSFVVERSIGVAQPSLPAMYDVREFTTAGGLLSYGISLTDTYRLVAGQVARILKGAKPATCRSYSRKSSSWSSICGQQKRSG